MEIPASLRRYGLGASPRRRAARVRRRRGGRRGAPPRILSTLRPPRAAQCSHPRPAPRATRQNSFSPRPPRAPRQNSFSPPRRAPRQNSFSPRPPRAARSHTQTAAPLRRSPAPCVSPEIDCAVCVTRVRLRRVCNQSQTAPCVSHPEVPSSSLSRIGPFFSRRCLLRSLLPIAVFR